MGAIRSVLWIGAAKDFPAGPLSEAPSLDVVWERDAANLRGLPDTFDAVVLDAADADAALRDLSLLRDGPARGAVLVRVDARCAERCAEITAAGAADVVLRPSEPYGDEAFAGVVGRLEALGCRSEASIARPSVSAPAFGAAAPPLVGRSRAIQRVLALIARAARSSATVLLSGETGTGKELVARAIHSHGARCDGPFVAFNCAALPESLLESELLGHARGAFTGAERERKGLVEEARGGTLFLDEVGDAPASFQAKLLRVVQERTVRPLGANRERSVDVRIVAASNRDLWRDVSSRRFREDLYYRLAVFPIAVPPLRERLDDLPPLADHFLARHGRAEHKRGCRLSPDALCLLEAHRWPGNVRELENEIQRALVLAEPGESLTPGHFSERVGRSLEAVECIEAELRSGETLRETLARVEAWLLRRALEANQQQRTRTARQLGITREGLYKKMKRYGIG
jgi:transcriptional regulator with PAS, ATPase and Fis domain